MKQDTKNTDNMVSGPSLDEVNIEELPDKEPEKKKGGAGKVIGLIILALLVLVIAGVVIVAMMALKDEMPTTDPTAYESIEMNSIITDSAKELVSDKTITIDADQLNSIISDYTAKYNETAEDFKLDDLFVVISDGRLNVYARIATQALGKDVVIPAQAQLDVGFEGTEVVITPEKVMCGKLTIPENTVKNVVDQLGGNLPEGMRTENGLFYYDVSGLNDLVDQEIEKNVNADDNWLTSIASSLLQKAVNVEITDAKIDNNKIVLTGSAF